MASAGEGERDPLPRPTLRCWDVGRSRVLDLVFGRDALSSPSSVGWEVRALKKKDIRLRYSTVSMRMRS